MYQLRYTTERRNCFYRSRPGQRHPCKKAKAQLYPLGTSESAHHRTAGNDIVAGCPGKDRCRQCDSSQYHRHHSVLNSLSYLPERAGGHNLCTEAKLHPEEGPNPQHIRQAGVVRYGHYIPWSLRFCHPERSSELKPVICRFCAQPSAFLPPEGNNPHPRVSDVLVDA